MSKEREEKRIMKIKALNDYMDRQLNRVILCGEVYEVTEERAKEIEGVGYAEILEEKKTTRKKVE